MLRRILAIAISLASGGFILLNLTFGHAAGGVRLGGEDVVSSYSSQSDRVAFSGAAQEGDEHPKRTILYMKDLKTGTKTKVFETLNGELGALAISPSGGAIAVQVYFQQGPTPANHKVLVLTAEGKEIIAFPDGRDFAWSPDSRFLAYTTGIRREAEVVPTGTWLFDQQFNNLKKIHDKGDFVTWSPVDNSLFIWSFSSGVRILRYDPGTQKIVETKQRGIFFSPTGRYYHAGIPRHGEGSVEVYDAQSNQPLLLHRPRIASILPNARIVGWASEGDVLILEVFNQGPITEEFPQGRVDTVIYDIAHDIARVIHDDGVIGWKNGQAIVHDRGKFTKRSLTSLPLLPEQLEKPPSPALPPKP